MSNEIDIGDNLFWAIVIVAITVSFTTCNVLPIAKRNNCADTVYIHDTVSTLKVKATYYNNTKNQCDKDYNITADGTKITKQHDKKAIALSRNLFKRFNMGDSVKIISPRSLCGTYLVFDKMNKRFKDRIDIFTYSKLSVDSVIIQI
jgi:3D (Asp-Asp-Asp) domain-containing protein